jgi:hypothetical protein
MWNVVAVGGGLEYGAEGQPLANSHYGYHMASQCVRARACLFVCFISVTELIMLIGTLQVMWHTPFALTGQHWDAPSASLSFAPKLSAGVHTWQHSSVDCSREWRRDAKSGRGHGSAPQDGCRGEQHCSRSTKDTGSRRQRRVVGGKDIAKAELNEGHVSRVWFAYNVARVGGIFRGLQVLPVEVRFVCIR